MKTMIFAIAMALSTNVFAMAPTVECKAQIVADLTSYLDFATETKVVLMLAVTDTMAPQSPGEMQTATQYAHFVILSPNEKAAVYGEVVTDLGAYCRTESIEVYGKLK